ncbi:MAG UNVERIFIED_CONTAM: hypothetical protein LVR18_26535 [Planctomycetaceae bacterium]
MLGSSTGRLEQEDATGRFHASLAFRREIFDRIGGWPLTKRGDFDQQLIAMLHAIEAPGDPCQFADPSYIFRWGQTNAYHGQAYRLLQFKHLKPLTYGWSTTPKLPNKTLNTRTGRRMGVRHRTVRHG